MKELKEWINAIGVLSVVMAALVVLFLLGMGPLILAKQFESNWFFLLYLVSFTVFFRFWAKVNE